MYSTSEHIGIKQGICQVGKLKILVNEFDKGRRTVIKLEDVTVIISREKARRGYDMIHINIDDEVDIKKWAKSGETLDGVPTQGQKKKIGNQTAGLPPYALVHGEKIRKRLLSESCVGNVTVQKAALLDLSTYVEMGTGRLRKGWDKSHRSGNESMTVKDIALIIGKQERQAKTIVKDLIANGLLVKQVDGYYLDRQYILRGKKAEEGDEQCDTTSPTAK
jgi:hypothetical protein